MAVHFSKQGKLRLGLALVIAALGLLGMTETAKEAGITREGLYKALSPNGNPTFSTVWNVLHAIGYTLTPTPIVKTI